MKKYQFKLEKVLKVKTIELDTLIAALNQIRVEIHTIEQKINELNRCLIDLNQAYITQINQTLTGHDLKQFNYKKESIKHQIEQLKSMLKELKLKENYQLNKVIEKKKEESMLNKLDEKQYELYMKQAQKKRMKR
jgi:flagellar export protein FliJ